MDMLKSRKCILLAAPTVTILFVCCVGQESKAAEAKKPNILVIWGDDIGVHNISAYNHGIMGYKTPNIDRWRIHPEGYNFLPYFKGEVDKGPREKIYYFSQGGELNALRVQDWRVHFATQVANIATGTRAVPGWPLIVNLRADPYEKGPTEAALGYLRWYGDNLWTFVPAQGFIKKFLATIPEYPVQEGSSINAAGINYNTLKTAAALKRLQELETITPDR
jgi:hypothetical protein